MTIKKNNRTTDVIFYYLNYFMFFYMIILTGGAFYLNYRINIISGTQNNTIKMFQSYAEKDLKQQNTIIEIEKNIKDLGFKIDETAEKQEEKLNDIIKIIINK